MAKQRIMISDTYILDVFTKFRLYILKDKNRIERKQGCTRLFF